MVYFTNLVTAQVGMLVLALVAAHCSANYARMDETGNTLFRDYAHSFLAVLPQDARLIVKGTSSGKWFPRMGKLLSLY